MKNYIIDKVEIAVMVFAVLVVIASTYAIGHIRTQESIYKTYCSSVDMKWGQLNGKQMCYDKESFYEIEWTREEK